MGEENELTTITIRNKTKDLLEKMKIHPNQSFDEVLYNLLLDFKSGEEILKEQQKKKEG